MKKNARKKGSRPGPVSARRLPLVSVLVLSVFFLATGVHGDAREPIVDIHCHVAGIGAGGSGCSVSDALRHNWRFRVYLEAFGVSVEDLEREGDALVIRRIADAVAASKAVDQAVVLALDAVVGRDGREDIAGSELYVPNAFVAREAARYENILFGASVNPNRRDALERLRQAARQGAVLVKWLPAIQNIDPADARHIPFYEELRRLGLPLLVHTGDEHSFSRARQELGDPKRLKLPLRLGVTVIAAHAATTGRNDGEENMDRLLSMFEGYPNLYADVSSLTQWNKRRYLPSLLAAPEARGRLVYGSDFPLINTVLVSPWIYLVRLGPARTFELLGTRNPWDRDVRLKEELGVPREVFRRGAIILSTGVPSTAP